MQDKLGRIGINFPNFNRQKMSFAGRVKSLASRSLEVSDVKECSY